MTFSREQVDLVTALHRDMRWLERQLKNIRDATAVDGDRLRALADAALEKHKRRVARSLKK